MTSGIIIQHLLTNQNKEIYSAVVDDFIFYYSLVISLEILEERDFMNGFKGPRRFHGAQGRSDGSKCCVDLSVT